MSSGMATMRSQVSRMGRLKGMNSMQGSVNLFGQVATDPGNIHQLLDGRRLDPGQPAKAGHQRLALDRPDTRQGFQRRGLARLAKPGALAGDGKTVSLIADFLDQEQGRMFR